ncbi:MAG: cell division protein FtsB [Polynucleobacter sp.]|jgi:cell division protein FtsB|nr:cell division protein FtsB [Polynucleobacter sp.]
MRLVIYAMFGLLIAIQYPLWLGKGGWLKVYEMERQLQAQKELNQVLTLRNTKLAGDVKDLKTGTRAIEERARAEHGMLKEGEYFVQILPGDKPIAEAKQDALAIDAQKPQ